MRALHGALYDSLLTKYQCDVPYVVPGYLEYRAGYSFSLLLVLYYVGCDTRRQ